MDPDGDPSRPERFRYRDADPGLGSASPRPTRPGSHGRGPPRTASGRRAMAPSVEPFGSRRYGSSRLPALRFGAELVTSGHVGDIASQDGRRVPRFMTTSSRRRTFSASRTCQRVRASICLASISWWRSARGKVRRGKNGVIGHRAVEPRLRTAAPSRPSRPAAPRSCPTPQPAPRRRPRPARWPTRRAHPGRARR